MIHIRQRILPFRDGVLAYTVVNVSAWQGELNQHPCLIEDPQLFELVDEDIPEFYQILNYI